MGERGTADSVAKDGAGGLADREVLDLGYGDCRVAGRVRTERAISPQYEFYVINCQTWKGRTSLYPSSLRDKNKDL